MPVKSAPLNILTFVQRWAPPQRLSLNVLVLPKGDPLAGFTPSFPDAALVFNAAVIPTLETIPTSAAATQLPITLNVAPPNRAALFQKLQAAFQVRPHIGPVAAKSPAAVKKTLTTSYRAATAYARPLTHFAVTEDAYECAIRDAGAAAPAPAGPPPEDFYWEEILGFVLRQPNLARELGLIYEGFVDLPTPNPLVQGGYIYVDLDTTSAYASLARARFAARIPPLGQTSRTLFSAVLFPVDEPGNFDQVFPEADAYDDGFAKIVHGAQPRIAAVLGTTRSTLPPVKDIGIRLGWDDEQVAIWLNRQLGINAYDPGQPSPGSPLGVAAYRVDVFDAANNRWQSLVHVRGNLSLDGISLGTFDDELGVEALPVNLNNREDDEFWLPSYFTVWSGGSLALGDPAPFRLAGRSDIIANPIYSPVDADAVRLRYGQTYQFRVRLMDLTGGGPVMTDQPQYAARSPVATVPFRRFSPPKAVSVAPGGGLAPDKRSAHYSVFRPPLGYPDIVYADFPNAFQLLLAQAAQAQHEGREPALPDPNVAQLRVEVHVRTLDGDTAATAATGQPFAPLYTTTLGFPPGLDQSLGLDFQFEDVSNLSSLRNVVVPLNAPLPLPSARDVRLVLTPIGSNDPGLSYWGSQEARVGAAPVDLYVSAPSADERGLVLPPAVGSEIEAIFLQSEPPRNAVASAQLAAAGLRHEATSDPVDRLAHHLELPLSGMTLSSPAGRRTIFGCSSAIRHTLNPDLSSVTFSARPDLTRHWIIALRLTLDRDWTWNALAASGFEVYRDDTLVGRLRLSRAVNRSALQNPNRDQSDLVFFDAVDPKPLPGGFPKELDLNYTLAPVFQDPATMSDPKPSWKLRLPITTPPAQVPKLVSAGLALSQYTHDATYSSSGERRRMLFLELDAPPADTKDAYFGRVLAYGPDPVLLRQPMQIADPAEPPLPIDSELIRAVTPNQSNDLAGLNAMQPLIGSPKSDRHYLLPLPPGLNADSPELFGFFVYELRVGHDGSRWSTAQGRFGHPLRVAGVQHPAPTLRCMVTRTAERVSVVAPYATPVLDGGNIRPSPPRTELHALLYAQVLQADGQSWRNLLLARAKGQLLFREERDAIDPALLPALMEFPQDRILFILRLLGLPLDAALSVIAVELLPEPEPDLPAQAPRFGDPVGADLGQVRILRASPLTPVPAICPPKQP